jgi:hypothetical protein
MSRKQALTLLASLFAAVAMMLGLTGTAVQAARPRPYPPASPSFGVDDGTVRRGTTVTARGRDYARNETVVITVTFRADGSRRTQTLRTTRVRVNRDGRFSFSVRTTAAGTLIIRARGSDGTESATVTVTDRRRNDRGRDNDRNNGRDNGRQARRVSFTSSSTVAAPPEESSSNIAGISIAGLLLLAGGGVFAGQAIRRRRRA